MQLPVASGVLPPSVEARRSARCRSRNYTEAHTMIMNLATAARIGAACAVLMCASCTDRVQAEAYTKAYQLTGRANVRVNAQWGAVRVITNDGNKVEFDVEYDRQEWASALPIESRQDGNAVTLTARVDEH